MVKKIVRDPLFLAQKSVEATEADRQGVTDLLDTQKDGAYQTEEGCVSLDGVRPCTRYQEIEVDYLDQNFKKQHGKYSGWTAQIIQHEIDHCNGIVIQEAIFVTHEEFEKAAQYWNNKEKTVMLQEQLRQTIEL